MLDARRRPVGRFFCGLGMLLLVWFGLMRGPRANAADLGVATTRVSDTVYRADGTPASGTVLISWPAFTTSDQKPVTAGTKSVVLGTGGALAVDLVPNAGATPTALYTVVFQIEVRWTDAGWGQVNDRNLVGRFTTRSFSVPRLARVQDYFVRQYDGSAPAKYSRYSTALHLDFPL